MDCVRIADLHLPSCVIKGIAILMATTALTFAQQPTEVVETAKNTADATREQVPTNKEAIEDHTEFHSKSLATDSKTKSDAITKRIKFLQQRQAEYLKNVAAGKIKPNADLIDKWDKIQSDVFAIRNDISALNNLDPNDRKVPFVEAKILSSLQQVGQYLIPAGHPEFTPLKLDKSQIAEMERIENAIENINYGTAADRKNAKPVEVIGSSIMFTFIELSVPLVLKSKPNEKIYLTADTGGAFSNGLSLIELETDDEGIANTTWLSIGDAVGICDLSIYSKVAIERQQIQIQVVAPSLPALEGLPMPDKSLLQKRDLPKLPKKKTLLNK
ncbi:MAG: hypothetical protein ACI9E1_001104 [Cryomorphaceae bacterium]|jgi:hypothetical protein